MSDDKDEIVFHAPVGAPAKYESLYVSIIPAGAATQEFDPQASALMTERLAGEGSAVAQFILGHKLLSGHGVERDAAAAYRWFSLAAASGRADAINMVGRCHECGWGVPVDRVEAARWYRQAVDKSNAWAMFNLASLMLAGDGVARDPAAALSLFVRAARRGNAKAMSTLGQYREEGWSCRPKLASAVRWYRRGAERGCIRGQYNLARFLAQAGNLDDAAYWLRAACSIAPPEFCREVGNVLVAHPDPTLQSIGREALARAASAPSLPDGPGSQPPASLFR